MAEQANTEKELMDWFDRQNRDMKWRISACVVESGRPAAETLSFLKAIDDRADRFHLVQRNPGLKH